VPSEEFTSETERVPILPGRLKPAGKAGPAMEECTRGLIEHGRPCLK
jgi:hypothetical protein